jgi:hypothetical protein
MALSLPRFCYTVFTLLNVYSLHIYGAILLKVIFCLWCISFQSCCRFSWNLIYCIGVMLSTYYHTYIFIQFDSFHGLIFVCVFWGPFTDSMKVDTHTDTILILSDMSVTSCLVAYSSTTPSSANCPPVQQNTSRK